MIHRRILFAAMIWLGVCSTATAGAAPLLDGIVERVVAWRNAWEQRQIGPYMSFYSSGFISGDSTDRREWERHHERLFAVPGALSVEISGLCVRLCNGRHAVATFIQNYRSPIHSDTGVKTLFWVKTDQEWEIASERWDPVVGAAAGVPDTGIEIRSIDSRAVSADTERLHLALSAFSVPKISALEGSAPRILLEFGNVAAWKGPLTVSPSGGIMQAIRCYLIDGCRTLRVLLDLDPTLSYEAAPVYFEGDKTFCLEIVTKR